MMNNPDSQKNAEHYNRFEKDKLDQKYGSRTHQGLPWKYVGILVGSIALIIIAIVLLF